LHDVRIWNDVRSVEEISLNYQEKLSTTPSGLIADWQMTGFNGSNQVVDTVSANNLSIGTASGTGFTASTPSGSIVTAENTTNGTVIGTAVATLPQYSSDIAVDGLFREAADPGAFTNYTTGASLGGWTVSSGNVDLMGTGAQASPLGGRSIDLNGSAAGEISQTLTTVAGRHYQIIFNVSGNFGSGEATKDFRVSAGGTSQDYSLTQPAGWSTSNSLFSGRSMTFTADSSSTTLRFTSFDTGAAGALIADVRVVEIPPAVQAVLDSDPSLQYDAGTGKFYKAVSASATWTAAQSAALASYLNGTAGELVTIGSRYENDLVWAMARQLNSNVWLGASDATTEGTWQWQSGAAAGGTFWQGTSAGTLQAGYYANWSSGEPNDSGGAEDYATMYVVSGLWNDFGSSSTGAYVIQWDASQVLSNLAYSLTSDANGAFAIDSNTGQISVADSTQLDYEAGASRNITVRVTDAAGATYDEVLTINLTDIDEFDVGAVSDSNASSNTVAENAAVGTAVGLTASAFDADGTTNTITYSLQIDDGGRFGIDASTGVVTVAGAIDREADGSSRSITVRATSADGSHTDQVFTIAVTDVDEFDVGTVSDTDAAADSVTENAAIGTAVGITALASDADATTNAITYSLQDNDGGRFAIDASTGVVTVAGAIDREAGATRSITVRATSADGSHTDQLYTIAVGDVDEFDTGAISDANGPTADSVAENAANGTVVGITASASDADATNNTISYSLDDNAGGRFAIDSSTGVVTVADGSLLDYESATSHAITVRATSSDGSSSTKVFTIALSDVNEFAISALSDSDAAADTVAENAAVGTAVGVTASASDADGTNNSVTYSLDDDAGGRFAIDASTGVVTVAGAIDREAAASYNLTVRATSSDTSSVTHTYTIAVSDVDEFDVGAVSDTDAAADSVTENAAIGTAVGVTASASDADATTNAITYSLQDDDGGRFAIDASTGVVTVAGAIDREAGATRSITVRATSADGSHTDQLYTIAVGDVDEFDTGAISDA
ncbi:MAG: cadherin domain-containing protein, partial [Aureliella sp.]